MATTDPFHDDIVRLKLGGIECPIAINYAVNAGVMNVPAAFEMTLGHAGLMSDLYASFPPYTPFELWIRDVKVQSGEVDALTPTGDEGSALTIRGRDMLKWLVDHPIESERSFAEKSFLDLTLLALETVGLSNTVISLSNDANRKAITGTSQSSQTTTFVDDQNATQTSTKTETVTKKLKANVGDSWWDFLAEQYRRAGLFLWADVDGNFVLTKPNGTQAPLYRILRRRDRDREPGVVNVLGQPSFSHDVTQRYTECRVHGRGDGGKDGHGKVSARHFDEEMIALLNPNPADRANGGKRRKPQIIHDDKVRTIKQATFLARRKMAESRRAGWKLSYTVAGHSTQALRGGGLAIWQPDTVIEVIDDDLGIEGPMYIESVEYRRAPQTTTTLNLLRVEDLIFAEEDVTAQKAGKRKGLKVRKGVTTVEHIRSETHVIWKKDPNWGGLPVLTDARRDKRALIHTTGLLPPKAR